MLATMKRVRFEIGLLSAQAFNHGSGWTFQPIPGIKLPKSSTQWSEANVYFQLEFKCLDAITDIDSFANRFQEAIYSYFATNCGTIKMKSKPVEHINRDIRRLKTKLRNLKSLAQIDTQFNNEIRMLSKQIRAILKTNKILKNDNNNISSQLKKNFWKTCNNIFSNSTLQSPHLSIEAATNFFKNTLNASDRTTFRIPNWINSLPAPSFQGNLDPPSYKEITTVIRRSKAMASPCPLDQISIIALKRCPIIRTYLHKLLSYDIYCDRNKL
ncbi:hypothetical protein HELRODRAFT_158325 [Helobdella robusta]|uniref:Uncharacterized protein n=1 Tax=Helobdella robusta TaxID=6412 RepID=T1EMN5_HELRO|nr:hypothetical protein HELRODRAFT_158325 [Helobdella robusta]ESO11960.1 hypothetical protein HELRODRAFT_158325 [Helobdella robusta]